MKVKIEFSADNAAFGENPQLETSRILRFIASRIEKKDWFTIAKAYPHIQVRDFNGNEIGFFTVDSWKRSNV